MFKFNKFSQFIIDGDNTILFNLQTEGFIILKSDLAKIVNEHKNSIDVLEKIHPELFREMQQKAFLIPENRDEVKNVVEGWKKADKNPKFFGIIVNPTLGCNLRCWYCYEKHDEKNVMAETILHSIYKLIEKKVAEPVLESLNVSFFGGEPLIGFKQVMMPLLKHATEVCQKKGLSLTSNITTNGVLLTDDVLNFLETVGLTVPATFQISLDGNQAYHDRSRVGENQAPTYKIIVTNIIHAAQRGHAVSARLNYTAGNANTFLDILDDFRELPQQTKSYIQFNFQQIWQDQANDIHERIEELKEIFRKEGFVVNSDHINHRHCCYADRENHVVINYDGNLFKCTARDFRSFNNEGVLSKDGELVWNERYKTRMEAKYSNKACLACKILPICNGGCSQNKIEKNHQDTCYKQMTEEAKDEQILRRLKEVIALHNKVSH